MNSLDFQVGLLGIMKKEKNACLLLIHQTNILMVSILLVNTLVQCATFLLGILYMYEV
jgi:hypothetical protein